MRYVEVMVTVAAVFGLGYLLGFRTDEEWTLFFILLIYIHTIGYKK